MLLIAEKLIRRWMCHCINRCAKASNKYMIGYNKNKESSYLKYWDPNNAWEISQKLPVNGFKWDKDPSEFDKSLKI